MYFLWNSFLSHKNININREHATTAINFTHMRNHKRGSISNVRKFNTLRGCWFGAEKDQISKEDRQVLDCRSVVKLSLSTGALCFLIYVVWRDNGSKKWYPALNKYDPLWPVERNKLLCYCLGLRQINVVSEEGRKRVTWKKGYN